jgi:hypothetical protein
MRENLYTKNFSAGGNSRISSTMQIYRQWQCLNILYTANLPHEAIRQNLTLVILPP